MFDYDKHEYVDFSVLKGKILKEVRVNKGRDDSIVFVDSDDIEYIMMHQQDCCEGVSIESIEGNTMDLVDSEILIAEESSDGKVPTRAPDDYQPESETWTFYKLATVK